MRPSPLMSATPSPWPMLTPHGPGSETSCVVHIAVGIRRIPLLRIERRVAQPVHAGMNQIGTAVAVDILEERLLVADRLNRRVLRPVARLPLRIHEEKAGAVAGVAAHLQHVGPAVAGEVEGEVDHRRNRPFRRRIEGHRRVDLLADFVVGAEVVERAGGDVRRAVVVEVGDGRAPRVVMRIDADLLEVLACLVGRPDVVQDVLVHEVLDSDFAGAADVEADLAVAVLVGVRDGAAAAAAERAAVELRLHAVLGEQAPRPRCSRPACTRPPDGRPGVTPSDTAPRARATSAAAGPDSAHVRRAPPSRRPCARWRCRGAAGAAPPPAWRAASRSPPLAARTSGSALRRRTAARRPLGPPAPGAAHG